MNIKSTLKKDIPSDGLSPSTRCLEEDRAASELARAARLERMANELLIEAREIRSYYAKPRKKKEYRNLVELAKSMGERR